MRIDEYTPLPPSLRPLDSENIKAKGPSQALLRIFESLWYGFWVGSFIVLNKDVIVVVDYLRATIAQKKHGHRGYHGQEVLEEYLVMEEGWGGGQNNKK